MLLKRSTALDMGTIGKMAWGISGIGLALPTAGSGVEENKKPYWKTPPWHLCVHLAFHGYLGSISPDLFNQINYPVTQRPAKLWSKGAKLLQQTLAFGHERLVLQTCKAWELWNHGSFHHFQKKLLEVMQCAEVRFLVRPSPLPQRWKVEATRVNSMA